MSNVSLSALIQRLNRKLAHEGLAIRKSRDAQLGPYIELDVARNAVTTPQLDAAGLEKWGRDLGVVRVGEVVS